MVRFCFQKVPAVAIVAAIVARETPDRPPDRAARLGILAAGTSARAGGSWTPTVCVSSSPPTPSRKGLARDVGGAPTCVELEEPQKAGLSFIVSAPASKTTSSSSYAGSRRWPCSTSTLPGLLGSLDSLALGGSPVSVEAGTYNVSPSSAPNHEPRHSSNSETNTAPVS